MRAECALSIELGTPRRSLLDNLDRLNPGAVEGEELLNANAIALAADGEVAGDVIAAVIDSENLALEILNAELIAFLNLDGDANDIASVELREVLLSELSGLLGVDLIQNLDTHDLTSFKDYLPALTALRAWWGLRVGFFARRMRDATVAEGLAPLESQ